jgi:putative FmdB family regulatory protein
LYEYRCEACEHQFEIIQKFSDDPISVCPSCGQGPVVKLLSTPAIQFKGSGWYITDYARKGQSGKESEGGKSAAKAEGGDAANAKPAAEGTPKAETTKTTKTTAPAGTTD